MAGDVNFTSGISISGGGDSLLNQLLGDLVNQTNFIEDLSQLKSQALLTNTRALGRSVKYSSLSGPVELDPILENGTKPEADRAKTPDKGFAIKEFGNKLSTTYLMRKWIEETGSLKGADASVLEGRNDFMNNGQYLFRGALYNVAIDVVNLLYKGFSITTSNGPGSATPKGKALFATNHSVRNGALTFRNTLTTANQSFSASSLQDALDTHKTQLRFDNGYRVKLPKSFFEIWTSRANAVNVRKVLNTPGSQSGIYSGVAGNANQMNQFSFDGNAVEIKTFELMGETDKNGAAIGNDTMWFVVNPDNMKQIKGLRYIDLYDIFVKNYINNETDAYVADIRVGYTVDHYGAESAIVGSLGTV